MNFLDAEIATAKREAYAKGSALNFVSQWRAYLLFYTYCQLIALPTSVTDLCRYIVFLTWNLNSYQTLKNYLNGVRSLHLCHNLPFKMLENFEVRLLLQTAKKRLNVTSYAKLPVEPQMLLGILGCLDLSSSFDLALWCSFLFGFFGFLRKSNIVPRSLSSFNPSQHLSRGNVTRTDFGLTITLTWSKTIQFGERTLQIPLVNIPDSVLDPVSAYELLCSRVPAQDTDPAFMYWRNDSLVPLTYSVFSQKLKYYLQRIGLDPKLFGGHSLRRGGCSWAFRAGVPVELLRTHGDWRSMSYLRYLDFSTEQRTQVTAKMARALETSN